MFYRHTLAACLFCMIILCGLTGTVQATSVYAITSHTTSTVQIYEIDGDQLDWQFKKENFPHYSLGAVDLAIDSDSDMLFASYESLGNIQLVNAKTMAPVTSVSTPAPIAGITYDKTNQRLLAIKRQYNDLYDQDKSKVHRSINSGFPLFLHLAKQDRIWYNRKRQTKDIL